jgi:hypothetical protein
MSGCSVPVSTDPERFKLGSAAVSHLRPTTVALNNAYESARRVPVPYNGPTRPAPRLTSDLRELTETAITALRGALEKRGVAVSAEAEKAVTLGVHVVGIEELAFRGVAATVILEARYGDEKRSAVEARNFSPLTYGRAIDGAVVIALNNLLGDAEFVAYMNASAGK